HAEEREPLAVAHLAAGAAEGRVPARALGWPQELDAALRGRACTFAQVARDAATDDVLPGGAAALAAGQDVIEVQRRARQLLAAVLAGVLVARVDVEARETHLRRRHAVVELEQDHARDADGAADGAHDVAI